MKKIILSSILMFFLTMGMAADAAPVNLDFVELGEVKYSHTGSQDITDSNKKSFGNFSGAQLQSYLISRGISILQTDFIADLNMMRRANDLQNQGRGGLFGGEYKKFGGDAPPVAFKLEATVNVWELNETGKKDINVNVRIIDNTTGEVVGYTSAWNRNTDLFVVREVIGPQPTWWERNITGYVREEIWDNMLTQTAQEAAKDIFSQLGELGVEGAVPDAERFSRRMRDQQIRAKAIAESGYRPLIPDEVRDPKPESSKSSESPYFELYVATDGAETWFFKPKACEDLFANLPNPITLPYPNWDQNNSNLISCAFYGGTADNIFDKEQLTGGETSIYFTDLQVWLWQGFPGNSAEDNFENSKTSILKYRQEFNKEAKLIELFDGDGFIVSHFKDLQEFSTMASQPLGEISAHFRVGNCVANFNGYLSADYEKFNKYHYYDREKGLVNLHPGHDHGGPLFDQKTRDWASKVFEGLKPVCMHSVNLYSPNKE